MDKCDYLAYYLHFQKSKWICYAPPFLQPFLRFYDSPSIVDARDNSLRVVLSLDRGNRTEIINADLGEFHPSEDHSFFQFMTDGDYVEFQKSLQSNDFSKVVTILKPVVSQMYQKSIEYLEDANWKGFLELEYWMLLLSFSWCFLELYQYGFYYLIKVEFFLCFSLEHGITTENHIFWNHQVCGDFID